MTPAHRLRVRQARFFGKRAMIRAAIDLAIPAPPNRRGTSKRRLHLAKRRWVEESARLADEDRRERARVSLVYDREGREFGFLGTPPEWGGEILDFGTLDELDPIVRLSVTRREIRTLPDDAWRELVGKPLRWRGITR